MKCRWVSSVAQVATQPLPNASPESRPRLQHHHPVVQLRRGRTARAAATLGFQYCRPPPQAARQRRARAWCLCSPGTQRFPARPWCYTLVGWRSARYTQTEGQAPPPALAASGRRRTPCRTGTGACLLQCKADSHSRTAMQKCCCCHPHASSVDARTIRHVGCRERPVRRAQRRALEAGAAAAHRKPLHNLLPNLHRTARSRGERVGLSATTPPAFVPSSSCARNTRQAPGRRHPHPAPARLPP